MSSKGKIARAAGVMSVATFISRILGFVRDMILARFFGATGTSDVFRSLPHPEPAQGTLCGGIDVVGLCPGADRIPGEKG